jgi:hypothetical protein
MNYISGICDDLLETILLYPSNLSVRDIIRFGSISKEISHKISENLNKYIFKLVSKNENDRCASLLIGETSQCDTHLFMKKSKKRHGPKDVFFDFHIRKTKILTDNHRELLSESSLNDKPLYIKYHMEGSKKRHDLKDIFFELDENEFVVLHSLVTLYYYSPAAIIITMNKNLLYTIYTFAQMYDQQVGYIELTKEDMCFRLVLEKKISFDNIAKIDINTLLSGNHAKKSEILHDIHKTIALLH